MFGVAPSAHAAAVWTPIASAPGQILDVDSGRILFQQSATQLAVLDRRTGTITAVPEPAVPLEREHAVRGFLTSHGAVVVTMYGYMSRGNPSRVFEWRDGTLLLLDDPTSYETVDVFRDVAIWMTDEQTLRRRDLAAGTTIDLGFVSGAYNDIAPNGDVVWKGNGILRRRAADGVVEQLAPGAAPTDPLTDGINTVWAVDEEPSDLAGVGPGNVPLADFTGLPYRALAPHMSYAVDGGWIAYNREDPADRAPHSIWRRAPGATNDVQVTPAAEPDSLILGLNDEGEVLYRNYPGLGEFFAAPGKAPVRFGTAPNPLLSHEGHRGSGDHVFSVGGRWYYVRGGALRRFQEGDAPVPGPQTTIDSGPEGIVESSAPFTFTFSSSLAGGTLECRLDGGEWAACDSPATYPAPADGLHTFMARTVAPGGEVESEPASQAWIVDTAGPVTTLEWPAHDSATRDDTPSLGGHAGSAYGDGEVTLEIWAGPDAGAGAPTRTLTSSPSPDGIWQVENVQPPLPEGVYTARARQTDVAGNASQSAARTFTIDLTSPDPFSALSPTHGAIVGPTPVMTWEKAVDGGSGIARHEASIVRKGYGTDLPMRPAACSGGTCWASPAQPLSGGEHTWRAIARDRADNAAVAPARDVVVDDQPPAPFSLTGPPDGSRTTDTTPSLTWQTTTDALAGFSGYDVFLDGERAASGLATPEFTPAAPLADGPHAWRVEARDTVGNVRSSTTATVVVDTTPPVAVVRAVPNPVLAGDAVVLDASGSTDAFGGRIVRHEWDVDGDGTFEAETGGAPTRTATFTTGEHQPAVRVTDEVGQTATGQVAVSARPVPLAGFAGVSINDGARFTNDPDVTVRAIWPPLSSALVLSNDGGFGDAQSFPLAAEIPWTIDDSGPERVPRTIYARFIGLDGARETYQDDIILDQTPPVLRSARITSARGGRLRLRLRARDNLSGLRRMQVAARRRARGPTRPFRRSATFVTSRRRAFVRVRDGAGNWSRWKRATGG